MIDWLIDCLIDWYCYFYTTTAPWMRAQCVWWGAWGYYCKYSNMQTVNVIIFPSVLATLCGEMHYGSTRRVTDGMKKPKPGKMLTSWKRKFKQQVRITIKYQDKAKVGLTLVWKERFIREVIQKLLTDTNTITVQWVNEHTRLVRHFRMSNYFRRR
jgi:hypothetical protein